MRTRSIYLFAGVGAVVLLFILTGIVAFWFVSRDFCREEQRAQIPSPDGKYVAWVYLRHCGFAAETYVHVNVLHSGEKPHGQLISGRIVNGMIFAALWDHEMKVSWSSPRLLTIECRDCWSRSNGPANVFVQQTLVRDVNVTYSSGADNPNESKQGE